MFKKIFLQDQIFMYRVTRDSSKNTPVLSKTHEFHYDLIYFSRKKQPPCRQSLTSSEKKRVRCCEDQQGWVAMETGGRGDAFGKYDLLTHGVHFFPHLLRGAAPWSSLRRPQLSGWNRWEKKATRFAPKCRVLIFFCKEFPPGGRKEIRAHCTGWTKEKPPTPTPSGWQTIRNHPGEMIVWDEFCQIASQAVEYRREMNVARSPWKRLGGMEYGR
ncbi:hypothetical protein CDAR_504501 [Caerostris darwini]|uniref:Uncharacterized protein n=1 Tax=Caerostris darwini TaxID=1538125 RepID=A0AAV4PQI3_9ARAC|nr:hypothetical protein CDAR_504501 [Caerostris darwini]